MKLVRILSVIIFSCQAVSYFNDGIHQCVFHILDAAHNNITLDGVSKNIVPTIINNFKNYACIPFTNLFIIIVPKCNELEELLQNFACQWTTFTKFLIISDHCETLKIFQILWDFYIINAMVANQKKFYTYNPINEQCGKNISSSIIETDCERWLNITLKPAQFYNCDIKLVVVIIPPYVIDPTDVKNPGYEIIMVREFSKVLNFSIKYIPGNHTIWGHRFADGTYSILYNKLYIKEVDLMVGSVQSNESFIKDFSTTTCYTYAYLHFHAPRARILKGWQTFLLVFEVDVWCLFGISAVLTTFTWKYIAITRDECSEYRSLEECAFRIWCVILSSFNAQPKTSFLKQMFVLWSVYCFIMSSTFQSFLMSFLTKPTFEKQISNIRELAESGLNYGGYTTVREVFDFPSNKYNYKIFENWINCPITEECINRSAEQRDFAVYKNSRQVNYLSNFYIDPQGRSKLYRFKENQIYYIWAAFSKNFPLFPKYNELALRAGQAGLIEKWDKDTQNLIQEREYSRGTTPLTMNDLKLAFIVLLLGHAISLCAFLHEIYKNKIWKKSFADQYDLHHD